VTRRTPDDFKAELDAHLALEADARRAEGLGDTEADGAARRALGNRTRIEERFYEGARWRLLAEARRDARQALRILGRSKRFAAAAIATLALGVGANTALTGAIDTILWSPLNVPRADEVVAIHALDRKDGRYPPVSILDYEDLRQRASSLTGLAGYVRSPRQIDVGGERTEIGSEFVTDTYFDVLEVRPILGRAFETADNTGPVGRPVVMLSERLWRGRFGRDAAVIGRQILLDGEPFDVIGIVPATYGREHNIFWQTTPEIWLPIATFSRFITPGRGEFVFRTRGAGILQLFGRLAPGATIRQAQAQLQTIATTLPRPGTLTGAGIEVVPAGHAKFYPGYRRSFSQRLALIGLIGVLVLVLACSNLANLLLERTTRRRQELALRSSLGAGRTRLIRQLLTESLVLGVPGFLASLLVAHLLLRLLSAYPLALGVPVMLDLHVTARVVLLCALTSVIVVLAFSLVPVLRATRFSLAAMAVSRDAAAAGRSPLAHALVAGQVALSAVLLAGALLMVRAIAAAHGTDLGFQTDHLIGLEQQRSPGFRGEQETVPENILDPARWGVPGLAGVAMAAPSPLYGWTADGPISDPAAPTSTPIFGDQVWATPGFFDVMRMPLLQGRDFRHDEVIDPSGDRALDPAALVVIVSRDLAERLWGGRPAMGQFVVGPWGRKPAQVIGVVADTRYVNLWNAPRPTVYRPLSPTSDGEILIRTTGPPTALLPQIERSWRTMSPGLGASVRTGVDYVHGASASQRLIGQLVAVFAALALVVASIGLHSAMAWSVERRRREIAIRMAVGGSPVEIASRVVVRACLIAGLGAVFGLVAAAALAPRFDVLIRTAASYDGLVAAGAASPYDLVAFAGTAGSLALVCLIAAAIPAARAARVDPAAVLKSE
jgi:predicted permease